MEADNVNKHELLKLFRKHWRRDKCHRRWELMCVLREQGKSWQEMGAWIGLHWSSAQRHWRRGIAERKKKLVEPVVRA